ATCVAILDNYSDRFPDRVFRARARQLFGEPRTFAEGTPPCNGRANVRSKGGHHANPSFGERRGWRCARDGRVRRARRTYFTHVVISEFGAYDDELDGSNRVQDQGQRGRELPTRYNGARDYSVVRHAEFVMATKS